MRKIVVGLLAPSVLLIFLTALPALAWEGRVVDVADGDTITIEPIGGGDRVKVRLYGIDCPEGKQSYGQAATGFVYDVALYKPVDVDVAKQGKDRYGRTVATITVKDAGVLQELLLDAGLAWVYPKYCKGCAGWYAMEAKARKARRGLWQEGSPVPPWEWRKGMMR